MRGSRSLAKPLLKQGLFSWQMGHEWALPKLKRDV